MSKFRREAERKTYTVRWSEEDGAFIAKVLEFPSLGAHGESPETALLEIIRVVKTVLSDLDGEKFYEGI